MKNYRNNKIEIVDENDNILETNNKGKTCYEYFKSEHPLVSVFVLGSLLVGLVLLITLSRTRKA